MKILKAVMMTILILGLPTCFASLILGILTTGNTELQSLLKIIFWTSYSVTVIDLIAVLIVARHKQMNI